jgi:hypothetical protein
LEIQKKRQVGDERVLAMLSGRMLEGEGKRARIVNLLSLVYCRLVQLPVLESGVSLPGAEFPERIGKA